MLKLLMLLGISMCLAYCSQNGILVIEITKKKKLDIPLIALIIMLSLFCGLRTYYNDTLHYIMDFESAPTVAEYWNTSPEWTANPLFYTLRSFFRHQVADNYHIFFVVIAFFTNGSLIIFIKRHTESFAFSMMMYFSIGLFTDTMAAMKQCLALAILTYAIEALLKKKILLFYIIVFIAITVHTYAIFLVILPLFLNKPWTIVTYITIFGFAFILLTFESAITGLLSVADEAGKNISEGELLDNVGINPLRLAVFAVPPLLSFIFQDNLNDKYDHKKNVMMNMSILSFLVMSLGLFTAANLFGRSAMYFELGSIIILPWILRELFEPNSARFVSVLAGICYIGFFAYLTQDFSTEYYSVTFEQFLRSIF